MDDSEASTSNEKGSQQHTNSEQRTLNVGPGLRITDLMIDCLKEVFEYLGLCDLLNVADSNKRLQQAAGFVYDRKYGKKRIFISPNLRCTSQNQNLTVFDHIIRVRSRSVYTSLRFVRCFGHSITHISNNCLEKRCFSLICYLNKYCDQSLIELCVRRYSDIESIFDGIQKPFEKVEKITCFCVI